MLYKTGLISTICSQNPNSYIGKIFLTFDIDWCADNVLHDTIDILEKHGAKATFFVTHKTDVLDRLRNKPDMYELGIHPNFNNLLVNENNENHSMDDILDQLLSYVPEARAIRSHSIFQNASLWRIIHEKGLTHDCNDFLSHQSDVTLKPWLLWNNVHKIPYFWEDDVECMYGSINKHIARTINPQGLNVYDFHPIHVYLNTENLDRYETSRPVHRDKEKLIAYRNTKTFGTRDALKQLLENGSCA